MDFVVAKGMPADMGAATSMGAGGLGGPAGYARRHDLADGGSAPTTKAVACRNRVASCIGRFDCRGHA